MKADPLGDYASAYTPDPRPDQWCPDCHARISRYNADYGMAGARCAMCEGKAAEALAADRAAKGQLVIPDDDPEEYAPVVKERRRNKWRECVACGEVRRHRAHGLCDRCLYRKQRGSKLRLPHSGPCERCSRTDIEHQAHGLCSACYSALRRCNGLPAWKASRQQATVVGVPASSPEEQAA